jgi:TPP-dependent indolepyruvate ferredoxin oxidoreductase alpha subunit
VFHHGLGCLAAIANKPRNLTIIIWDNGLYRITGKQETATGGVTDIVAVARGAGLTASEWVATKRISTSSLTAALTTAAVPFLR